MRILIVDDDHDLRELIKSVLEDENYIVDTASDGDTGSYIARTNYYDVIILDNILPKKNGMQVCREIRLAEVKAPILLLSVLSEISDKVTLLDNGADDYMSKPFSPAELISRVKALSRRPYKITDPVLTLDDLTLDTENKNVKRGTKKIYLTRKEYMLLECLMKKNGKPVSRSEILEEVWNNDSNPFSNTIESHVLNLRKKIDFGSKKKILHTVSGRGYKIDYQK